MKSTIIARLAITMLMVTGLYSCTKTITVDLPKPDSQYVVEGYIENGRPPYVILTHNAAFFGTTNVNDLASFFEHGAMMKVWDGTDTVLLSEFCIGSLPDSLKRVVAKYFGYSFTDTSVKVPNICIYTIPNVLNYFNGDSTVFMGKPNHTYGLEINVGGKKLTSQTYIPGILTMQLSYKYRSTDPKDSLVTIYSTFDEPDTPGNYARTFTKQNSQQFYPLLPQSAFDDKLFNGQHYTFPLQRGQDPYATVDNDTYGFFFKGDTATIKFCQIDAITYRFWHGIESDGGDSPFTSPVRVQGNVNGALGIWCGYGAFYTSIIIPK